MMTMISDTIIERLGIVVRLMWYDHEKDEMVDDLRDYVKQYPYWVEFLPLYVYLSSAFGHEDWNVFGSHSPEARDSTFSTLEGAREFVSDLMLMRTEDLLKKYRKDIDPRVIS